MSRVASLPGLGPDYISQFFQEDVVVRTGHGDQLWVVLRCWADEDPLDLPEDGPLHPLDRPLLKGEVGIKLLGGTEQMIVAESSVKLFRRDHDLGDIVKRSLLQPENAVVLESKSEVKLQHVFTDQKVDEWVPADLLIPSIVFERGDRVIYRNWIGTVEAVFEAGMSIKPDGTQHWLLDPFSFTTVGRTVQEVKEYVLAHGLPREILSCECLHHDEKDKILRSFPVKVMFKWNAINQKLSAKEQKKWPQPPPILGVQDLIKVKRHLRIDDMTPTHAVTYLRSMEDYKRYNITPSSHGGTAHQNWAVKVIGSRSKVRLLWQDGSITEEWSTDVVPHERYESEDSWPGEYVMLKGDDGSKRPAVVQSCDPRQRTVDLFFPDSQERQTVSALELDPDPDQELLQGQVGIDIGTEVLLCDDSGARAPCVLSIGEFQPLPVPAFAWQRHVDLLEDIAEQHDETFQQDWRTNRPDTSDVDWYGHVCALRLDGRVDVKLANNTIVTVELKNLYSLHPVPHHDDPDDIDVSIYDDGSMFADLGAPTMIAPSGGMFFGPPRPNAQRSRSDASWETTDDEEWDEGESADGMDVDEGEAVDISDPATTQATNGTKANGNEDDAMSEDARDIEEIDPMNASSPVRSPHSRLGSPDLPSESQAGPSTSNGTLRNDEHWVPFDVLESAPMDHRFYGEASAESSRSRMSRLNKEHKALRNSLPENILVRSYEDRMDLLRVLIIGPEGTPYGGAPFVFDVFLHGNYPFEPPVVHFHSHTNGKGRCNPNLYEDGKVCLSILGTWAGDASESWNASKSSLLQVFVSISGLVLVRNPYHCEPAFAKLEGTREGLINSRQYSEKAYYLSRSFVRQALLHPPASLANEIRFYYITKGRLKGVIDHARTLMDKTADAEDEDGEGGDRWNADAIGSLTVGAKLSLKRVVEGLEQIWADHQSSLNNGTS